MDGCKAVELISRSEEELIARLTLSRGKVSQSFTTRNILKRPETMEMRLEEGPFSHFSGLWTFKALNENACKVSLDLEFTVTNKVVAKAVEQLFKSVGDELVDAVCRRANQI
jgi:ribosome-associated toxin RatA of RatAB toxin-antitoxin module